MSMILIEKSTFFKRKTFNNTSNIIPKNNILVLLLWPKQNFSFQLVLDRVSETRVSDFGSK